MPEGEALAFDDDDVRVDRLAQRRRELGRLDAGRLGEQRLVGAAGDRQQPQQPAAGLREPLDPEQQRLAQARRQRAAAVDPGREQLLGEQRVALAAAVEALDHDPLRLGPEDVGELTGELLEVEARQLDAAGALGALELDQQRPQRVAAVQLVGPVGRDDDDPLGPQAAGEEAEEGAGRVVGPVDVLDPEQRRALGAEPRDQLEEGVEEPPLRLAALALGLGRGLADRRVEAGELGPGGAGELVEDRRAGPLQRAQRRDQRRVGELVVAELDAGATDHRGAVLLRPGDHLAQQPRLADAGLAGDVEEGGDRFEVLTRERPAELIELGFPADEAAAAHALSHRFAVLPDRGGMQLRGAGSQLRGRSPRSRPGMPISNRALRRSFEIEPTNPRGNPDARNARRHQPPAHQRTPPGSGPPPLRRPGRRAVAPARARTPTSGP